MLTARLHFDNGTEVDQPIPAGQTLPYQLRHVEDGDEVMIVRTFAYRRGQSLTRYVIHYDELPATAEAVRKHAA